MTIRNIARVIILVSLITWKSHRNVPLNVPWQSLLLLDIWTWFLQKFCSLFHTTPVLFSWPFQKNGMVLEESKIPKIVPRHLKTQVHWTIHFNYVLDDRICISAIIISHGCQYAFCMFPSIVNRAVYWPIKTEYYGCSNTACKRKGTE